MAQAIQPFCDMRPTGQLNSYRCHHCQFEVETDTLPIYCNCTRDRPPIEPGLLERARTGSAALANQIVGPGGNRDQSLSCHLSIICSKCKWLAENATCAKCGCKLKYKVTFTGEACPIGEWDELLLATGDPVELAGVEKSKRKRKEDLNNG